jgi:hypothetical protein
MRQGIIYIAFGQPYLSEMRLSILSVRRFHPEIPITIFADNPVDVDSVDEFHHIAPTHLRPKIDFLAHTPYDQTLFLDTDTIIDSPIDDVFQIFPKFDLGLCHDLARKRKNYSEIIPEYARIPYAFPELNTGVIAFRKNDTTIALLNHWKKLFYKYYSRVPWDQPSFRVAAWESSARLHTFPVEYNIRSKANRKKQKIMHDRFGAEHLKPKIFHMHADPKIRTGKYRIKSLHQALKYCRKNFFPY